MKKLPKEIDSKIVSLQNSQRRHSFIGKRKGIEKAKWKIWKTSNSLKPDCLYLAIPFSPSYAPPFPTALLFLPLTCSPSLLASQKPSKQYYLLNFSPLEQGKQLWLNYWSYSELRVITKDFPNTLENYMILLTDVTPIILFLKNFPKLILNRNL